MAMKQRQFKDERKAPAMNKLSLIFIAGALLAAGCLSWTQSQRSEPASGSGSEANVDHSQMH